MKCEMKLSARVCEKALDSHSFIHKRQERGERTWFECVEVTECSGWSV